VLRQHDLPVPTPAAQGMKFISSLDANRYRELQTVYSHQDQSGIGGYPADLTTAFNRASDFMPQFRPKGQTKKPAGVAYTAEAEATVEETKDTANYVQQKAKKKEKRRRAEETEEEEVIEAVVGPKRDPFCKLCKKEGHWTSNCRDLKKLIESRDAILEAAAAAKQGKAYNTRGNTDRPDKKIKFGNVTYGVNVAPYHSMNLGDFQMVLDTAANIALVKDIRLLSQVHQSENTVRVKGVNGQVMETSPCGTIDCLGITAFYCPKAEINLIPLSPLEEKFQVIYIQRVSFEVAIPNRTKVVFKRTAIGDEGNLSMFLMPLLRKSMLPLSRRTR
jgi:hypothetical protein